MTNANALVILVAACSAFSGCAAAGDAPEEVGTLRQPLSGGPTFNFVKVADWGTGYNARVDLTNNGTEALSNWEAWFDMPLNVTVNVSLPPTQWGLLFTPGIDNQVRLFPGSIILPGQTLSVYLNGNYEGEFGDPVQCSFVISGTATKTPCDGSNDVTPPTLDASVGFIQSGLTTGFFFGPGADDTGVTGYIIKITPAHPGAPPAREIGEIHTTFAEVSRLESHTPNSFYSGRYIFHIEARDAAGNLSNSISTAITEVPPPPLQGNFTMSSQWDGGGFQGAFTITNPNSAAIDDWHVGFNFDGTFHTAWNGKLTGSAPSYTLSAPDHDRRIEAGESVTVGVVGVLGPSGAEPTSLQFSMGDSSRRPLVVSHPDTCASTQCPSMTHCVVQSDGYPACIYGSP